ncbi:hypothetical protein CIAN88_20965 [[Clostridium] innocuum]|uniref:Nuclease SbcCD subunit C n=1 Tax=Clostridium innocuum TaxID=1522 RepID=A0A099I0F9_CLOIN|nr:AAA family ATPase [[Clostridium] innocuum]KGJ51434.1 hypothetical protein CIAN88_20965 [[Clostridium] innocuum]
MLLQSIELKNFRQFVNERIDFSTDPDRNVTLIIGENGTGKTTFAQAFFWCLYGSTEFTDKLMINRVIAEEMTPDQNATVSVVLKLRHGSADYEIKRTQEYKKSFSNKVSGANSVLNISVKSEDGNTRYLKPLECESEIKKILPKELSNYFFFDGERIEKMSKEIASGKKASGFATAVVGLTGLNAFLEAIKHLSPTSINSVIGRLNNEYKGDSSGKIQALTKEIEVIQENITKYENRVDEIEEELSAARLSKSQFEEDIKQFADGEKLQNERDNLNKTLNSIVLTKAQFVKNLTKTFNNEVTQFLSLSLAKRALEELSQSDLSGKDIPEMHSKTIEFLLNRGMCICGTHLDPGTTPYLKVKELLEYLPPQSIGVTVGQFVKDTRQKYVKDISLFQSVSEQIGNISSQEDKISELQDEIAAISDKLDGDDVRSQVRTLNNQINACARTIKEREDEKNKLLIKIGSANTEKSQKENSRSELSLLDKNNQQVELFKDYAMCIYQEILDEYKEKETTVREKLETLINEIFKTIYEGGLSLSIDEKYNISVFVTDYDGGVETSTAQSISVIFAFISAIIKMARDNQRENGDESYSEPYPLVMDAPLSAFDKRRIKAICTAIPETAEQVIIFIKDTDGELAEENLGDKVMKRHYFEKIDEFNTRLV